MKTLPKQDDPAPDDELPPRGDRQRVMLIAGVVAVVIVVVVLHLTGVLGPGSH